MQHWVVLHADGSETHHQTNGDDPKAEGIDTGVKVAEAPHGAQEGEKWDWKARAWVPCDVKRAAISASIAANVLPIIHARKALEAWDWQARNGQGGHWPMIEAEAGATGVTVEKLVASIIDHDRRMIAAECARRIAKAARFDAHPK